jgi:hypothetical protein
MSTPIQSEVPPIVAPEEPTAQIIGRLFVPVEFMRFCSACDSEQRFIADQVCATGLVGRCSKCDEVWVAEWTRTTTEAA